MAVAIELRDIVKRFPGVVANDGVNLSVESATIHALIGENGAGKSTVMKILYGSQQPDEGHIFVNGSEVHFKSARDAIASGIGMVFQHFMLADNLTVWENVALGMPEKFAPKNIIRRVERLSAQYGLNVDPLAFVGELGVGERQRVEILKVLYRGATTIILDEPTAVLVPQEVDELFESLRGLTAQGATIIFISHKLDEVLAIANDITVVRAGKTVAQVKPSGVTARDLAQLMVGSELPSPDTRSTMQSDKVTFSISGLTLGPEHKGGRNLLHDISLAVCEGEIVGIAGVEGNGQTELLETIIGIRTPMSGSISIAGIDVNEMTTRDRREMGMGYIPEDRQREGMLLPVPLHVNTILGYQTSAAFSHGPWIDQEAAMKRTSEIIDEFDVRTPGPSTLAFALSGGNQQKFIVGREMLMEPKILIAAHPTRGIDVGAQAQVWDAMRTARDKGMALLLISADLDELIGLSDRLLVMLRGNVVANLDPATITKAELGRYMTGAHTAQDAA